MSWFKRNITLSEEEQLVKDIITSMLNNPKTLIEINPDDMSYLLSDLDKSYFIEVDSVGVKVTNHSFMLDKRMSSDVIDSMKNLIKTETTKRRSEKKEKIFQNGLNLLTTIKQNLENGKENNS